MFQALHQVDARSSRDPSQAPFGHARTPQPAHDRQTVIGTWQTSLILFDARIRTLQLWSKGAQDTSSSMELDWCIACLADIRSALYQLHARVVDEQLSLAPNGPAIVSYLSEAYVWCGDVVDDVQGLVQELRGGSVRDVALAEDSSAYIDDFLDPLFHEMCESCRGATVNQPRMRVFLPLAERLHVAILSLAWVLQAT
jgi:hypothetical protein